MWPSLAVCLCPLLLVSLLYFWSTRPESTSLSVF